MVSLRVVSGRRINFSSVRFTNHSPLLTNHCFYVSIQFLPVPMATTSGTRSSITFSISD